MKTILDDLINEQQLILKYLDYNYEIVRYSNSFEIKEKIVIKPLTVLIYLMT